MTWKGLIATALLIIATNTAVYAGSRVVRIRDLPRFTGRQVTIEGRTGVILESEGSAEIRVFTLRDDYGDGVHVRTKLDYPIMGVTLRISGVPRTDSSTGIAFFEEYKRERVYPPAPLWVIYIAGVAVVLAVTAAGIALRRRIASARLPQPWGHVEVVSGPDQGHGFALRDAEAIVGRQNPDATVLLEVDQTVSRRHGKITKSGSDLYYEDTESTGGSWVNERPVQPGERVLLSENALVRLGPSTILRVSRPSSGTKTRVWSDNDVENLREAKTQYVPGSDTPGEATDGNAEESG